jgi:hypothetical protein
MALVQIEEKAKIGILSLSQKIESKELTVNKAYKAAIENGWFAGSIGDFIETLKSEGLINQNTNEEIVVNNGIDKKKIVKKVVTLGLIALASYGIYKVIKK